MSLQDKVSDLVITIDIAINGENLCKWLQYFTMIVYFTYLGTFLQLLKNKLD